jgi:hypothetical protein
MRDRDFALTSSRNSSTLSTRSWVWGGGAMQCQQHRWNCALIGKEDTACTATITCTTYRAPHFK